MKPTCDYQVSCEIIEELRGVSLDHAKMQRALRTRPHLAEILHEYCFADPREAIDMARAIQELRHCPPSHCACCKSAEAALSPVAKQPEEALVAA